MNKKNETSIDAIVESFELANLVFDQETEKKPLTFWVPVEYKVKYDLIQDKTKKQFGKLLIEVLKRSIEKVET